MSQNKKIFERDALRLHIQQSPLRAITGEEGYDNRNISCFEFDMYTQINSEVVLAINSHAVMQESYLGGSWLVSL